LVKEELTKIICAKEVTDISSIKVIASVLSVLTKKYDENTDTTAVMIQFFSIILNI
jgi:hypothetical protein